jgi:hypothetical protein
MDFWLKNHQWKRGRCRSGCTVSSILRSLRVGHIHATCFGLWCVWNDCDRVIPNLPQRTPFLHVDRRLSIFHKSIYCTVTVGRGIRGTFPEFALSCFVQSSNATSAEFGDCHQLWMWTSDCAHEMRMFKEQWGVISFRVEPRPSQSKPY